MSPLEIVLAVGGVAFSSFSAALSLGWWSSGRFRSLEKGFDAVMTAHEALDQKRHEDNLDRFSNINVKLAGMQRHQSRG